MREYATEKVAVALKNKHVTNSQHLGELFVTLRHFHQVSHSKTLTGLMDAYDPHRLAAASTAVPCRNAVRCWCVSVVKNLI